MSAEDSAYSRECDKVFSGGKGAKWIVLPMIDKFYALLSIMGHTTTSIGRPVPIVCGQIYIIKTWNVSVLRKLMESASDQEEVENALTLWSAAINMVSIEGLNKGLMNNLGAWFGERLEQLPGREMLDEAQLQQFESEIERAYGEAPLDERVALSNVPNAEKARMADMVARQRSTVYDFSSEKWNRERFMRTVQPNTADACGSIQTLLDTLTAAHARIDSQIHRQIRLQVGQLLRQLPKNEGEWGRENAEERAAAGVIGTGGPCSTAASRTQLGSGDA